MIEQVLDASELRHQLLSGFLSHTGTAGDIVRRVAHQPQYVYHLCGRFDGELGFYLFDAHHFKPSRMSGPIHKDVFAHQLPIVFVGSHHIGGDSASSRFGGERAYHIVRLVSRHFEDRNAIGTDNLFDERYRQTDIFGRFLTLSFVLLESLMAKRWAGRVERHSYMSGVFLLQHFFKRVYEAEDSRCI